MSKKLIAVAAERLEIGMYIDSISGSWLDNPFWRSSFMIADPVTLQRLRKLGQVQCWIDSSRSVEEGTTPAVAVEAAQATNDVARTLGSVDAALRRFAPLRQRAGESAATIFRELRLGRAIASEECHALVLAITDATSEDPDAALALLRLKQKDEYSWPVCALGGHLPGRIFGALALRAFSGGGTTKYVKFDKADRSGDVRPGAVAGVEPGARPAARTRQCRRARGPDSVARNRCRRAVGAVSRHWEAER